MNRPEKVIYTAKVHTTGGRVGSSRSDDGKLDVKLTRPGTSGAGTNPEQLFAAGWSACYQSAMELVARRMKLALPTDFAVDAEVDLGPNGAGFDVSVRLNVNLRRGPVARPGRRPRRPSAPRSCPASHPTWRSNWSKRRTRFVRIPGRRTATSRSRRISYEPQLQSKALRIAKSKLWVERESAALPLRPLAPDTRRPTANLMRAIRLLRAPLTPPSSEGATHPLPPIQVTAREPV